MCRNLAARMRAIEEARGNTPHVIEVYDTYDPSVPDLVALIEVMDESVALVKSVNRYGELELHRVVPHWDDPSRRQIADLCGMDARFTRVR